MQLVMDWYANDEKQRNFVVVGLFKIVGDNETSCLLTKKSLFCQTICFNQRI